MRFYSVALPVRSEQYRGGLLALLVVSFLLMIDGTKISAQQADEDYNRLLGEVDSLRAALEQQRAENQQWQSTFEARLLSPPPEESLALTAPQSGRPLANLANDTLPQADQQTGDSGSALRQLERRVPSFEALPADSRQDLLSEVEEMAENFIEIHGYLRSGGGANAKGGSLDVFRAPGAGAKYRLGNERDTYGELIFEKTRDADEDKPFIHGTLLIAFQSRQNTSFDPDFDKFAIRESYSEISNLAWVPKWHFWAGQRYYDRHDIHINDFYFLDMSGFGGGITGIDLGICTLDIAYLTGALEDFANAGVNETFRVGRGRLAKHNLDMRLQGVPAPLGNAILWLNLATSPGGMISSTNPDGSPGPNNGTIIDSSDGVALGAIHVSDEVLGGFNKASVLWGTGAASNFSTSLYDPLQDVNATSQFLATETLTIQPNDWFTMQATTLVRIVENGPAIDGKVTWTSAGVRPIVHLTQYWAIAFEYGADHVDNEPLGVSGTVNKFTIAPELRNGNKFFSRPSFRLFVTRASWPEQFKGLVGADGFRNDTHGTTLGCQFESWW